MFFYFKIFINIVYSSISYKRKKYKNITIINYIIKNVDVKKLNFNEVEKNKIGCENICNKQNIFENVEVNNITFKKKIAISLKKQSLQKQNN